jgi:hypothetical protein
MWGPSIVGFGNYHYKYASGHEGDSALAAFAVRGRELVVYIAEDFEDREVLLGKPGKRNITSHRCEECSELRDAFSRLKWDQVPTAVIDENFGQLSLFTPEAYRYFLPAYLLRCLDNLDPESMVCEFVIYSLTPDSANEETRQWAAERHQLFDQKQQAAIVEFLDLIQSSDEFKTFHDEVAKALRVVW